MTNTTIKADDIRKSTELCMNSIKAKDEIVYTWFDTCTTLKKFDSSNSQKSEKEICDYIIGQLRLKELERIGCLIPTEVDCSSIRTSLIHKHSDIEAKDIQVWRAVVSDLKLQTLYDTKAISKKDYETARELKKIRVFRFTKATFYEFADFLSFLDDIMCLTIQ